MNRAGHIIFYENAVTGDGLLTGLKLLECMKDTNKSVQELSEGLFIYPQLLKNVRVKIRISYCMMRIFKTKLMQ